MHRVAITLLVLAGAGVWLATGMAQSQAPEQLPDLDEEAPKQLGVRAVRTEDGLRFRLGFRSSSVNVGKGPLFIKARRQVRDPRRLHAEQVIVRLDGSTETYPNVGWLTYERFKDHQHWHMLGYARYELRKPGGGLARPDLKQGFCLADSFHRRAIPKPPIRVREVGHLDTDCGKRRPDDNYLEEGISVGWGDDYDPHLEGQQIDVTGLRAGAYVLVHRVNPERRLRELRYDNNDASVRLRLTWPGGRNAPPRVKVLRRCPGRASCPAR